MKTLIIVIGLIVLTSCASINIETTTKAGTVCKASGYAFFMGADQMQAQACHGSMNAVGSGVDPLAGALIDALLKAAGK